MSTTDLWTYRDTAWSGAALSGMDVEATDGGIGKIETATDQFIVVDTGPWIFGKKVMLPAGVIDRVDLDDETVFISRTKDEIKNAPEYDESQIDDDAAYRDQLGTYYGTRV
jgi:hypothetical protein